MGDMKLYYCEVDSIDGTLHSFIPAENQKSAELQFKVLLNKNNIWCLGMINVEEIKINYYDINLMLKSHSR